MADSAAPVAPIRPRNGVANPEGWEKKTRKKDWNQGKEYFTKTKAGERPKVEAKRIGGDCHCPLKCFVRVSEEGRLSIFNAFWKMGDWNAQNSYFCGSIKTTGRYGKKDVFRGKFFRHYYVKCNSVSIRVCKKAFLAIHGVSNDRVSRSVIEKGTHESYKRGKFKSANIRYVKSHIESIPAEVSHYCRKDNPNRRYLSADLNIRKM